MKPILEKRDFQVLDSIRGIAALYVTIAHCRGVLWLGGGEFTRLFPRQSWDAFDTVMFGASMLTRLAVEFVIVFFVLSGFSIAHSLSSNTSPWQFYKRRLIRIYPTYLGALIWAGMIYGITKYYYPEWYDGTFTKFAFIRTMEMNEYLEPKVVAGNLFYMPMHGFIGPFWSLTYEVIFYLLAPFLLRKANIYIPVSVLLFAANLAAPSAIAQLNLPLYIHDFLFTFNVFFAVGVFLYLNYQRIAGWLINYTVFEFLLIFGGFLAIMFGANIYLKTESLYTFIEAAMFSCVLIIFFLKYKPQIKWLMWVGKFSYTLYITHFASIYLYLALYWKLSGHREPYIVNFFIWMGGVVFCLLMGWLHYLLVEKNTQKVLTKLRKKATPAPAMAAAGAVKQ